MKESLRNFVPKNSRINVPIKAKTVPPTVWKKSVAAP